MCLFLIMRVAYCLYGQPRDYRTGFKYVKEFLERNSYVTFDFYFHAWKIPQNELYETSPWIHYSVDVLKQDENIETNLLKLYNPVDHVFEDKKVFDMEPFKNTLAFQNMITISVKQNIHNVISQMYSRMKVCNLFKQSNIKYDYVITSRFDYCHPISIDLNKINLNKTYVSNMHVPRHILPDRFMMFPVDVYKSVFSDIFDVFSDKEVDIKMKQHHEVLAINPEEVILAMFLKVCGSTQSVIFTKLIN